MPDTPKSALITTINTTFEGVDLTGLAHELELDIYQIPESDLDISKIIAADPLADKPVLVVGSGNLHLDSRIAALLGLPLIILNGGNGTQEKLAREVAEELGAVVGLVVSDVSEVTKSELDKLGDIKPRMSALLFQNWLLKRAREAQAHIVLPEGEDDRILKAAHELLAQDICKLTILGDVASVEKRAGELQLNLEKANIVDPYQDSQLEEFAQQFAELRKAKGVTIESARETMKDISYYATMMVYNGVADGMVSGAAHTTAHTIKPSLQIIKTVPEASVVSSIFLMVLPGRVWAFGDCAVNPNPTAEQLGEIAVVSAKTAAQFGIDPKVALLSYSTGNSGSGPDVDRALAATAEAKRIAPELCVDGPLQFDAAVDPGVAKKKMPESPVAGQANVFIFPDLEAGNIGYKAVQRAGDALAIGPILQGLKKPVNDLSRGATVPDIINTVAITAIQAGGK